MFVEKKNPIFLLFWLCYILIHVGFLSDKKKIKTLFPAFINKIYYCRTAGARLCVTCARTRFYPDTQAVRRLI